MHVCLILTSPCDIRQLCAVCLVVGLLTKLSTIVRVNLWKITYLVRAIGELLQLKTYCNTDGVSQAHVGFDYLQSSDPS